MECKHYSHYFFALYLFHIVQIIISLNETQGLYAHNYDWRSGNYAAIGRYTLVRKQWYCHCDKLSSYLYELCYAAVG